MHCRYCLYNLSHTETPRCPECGCAFDPRRPGATTLPTGSRLRWLGFHAEQFLLKGWSPGRGTPNIFCRTCFADLRTVAGNRCPVCSSWFDRQDSLTFCRSDDGVTRLLLRLQHVCLWRGLLIPLIPLAIGVHAIVARQTLLPGPSRHGMMTLEDSAAVAMGLGWLGAALALHVHYFWARIEPTWRYALLFMILALTMLFGGWIYATVQAVAVALR